MIDTANRVVRQLRVAGSPVDQWDHFMVYALVSRMAPRTLTSWETTQDLEAMPTLDDVLRFLERRARGIINLNASQSNEDRPKVESRAANRAENRSENRSENRAEYRAENSSSGLKCFKCNGAH